jgi:hypothetical protein
MKIFTQKTFLIAILAMLAIGVPTAKACNLASVTLCGLYKSPLLMTAAPTTNNDSMICLRLCVGWGVTGVANGADSDTRSISFGWKTHRTGFLIRAFSPDSVTSGRGFSNCVMPGADVGPQPGAPYNSQGTILYVDPGYYRYSNPVLYATPTPVSRARHSAETLVRHVPTFFSKSTKFQTLFGFTE